MKTGAPLGRPRGKRNGQPTASSTERSRAWRTRERQQKLAAARAEVARLEALLDQK